MALPEGLCFNWAESLSLRDKADAVELEAAGIILVLRTPAALISQLSGARAAYLTLTVYYRDARDSDSNLRVLTMFIRPFFLSLSPWAGLMCNTKYRHST